MPSGLILPYTDNYAAVLRDESRTVGYADTVSFPRCEEEVCEILRELYAESTPITVQGARTGLAAAAVPFGGHVLNTANMNRVLGMREENGHFYLRVQPGLALLNLRKMIAKKNFNTSGWDTQSLTALELFKASPAHFFPTDPTETTAALGGMAACNASGARSYRYGPMRRHITALRAVLTDGSVIALRRGQYFADGLHFSLPTVDGRAIEGELPTYTMPHTKNASGYYVAPDMDLIDLLIGSDGTLAVMTELELALSVLPAVSWGVTVFLPDEPSACAYAESVREQLNCAAAIEYFDPHALDILREQKKKGGVFARLPDLELAGKGSAVFVELHCDDEASALAALSQLAGLAESVGGDPAKSYVARTELDSETLGFFRHAVPESVNSLIDERKRVHPGITKLGSDMSVPNGRLMEVTGMYRRTLAEEDLQYASWGHIGDNHIHVNILPRDMNEHARCKALFKRWAKTVTEMGGAVSAEHGVGKLKAPFLTIMYGEEHIRQMRALKRLFDPGYQLGRNNLFSMEEES
ncbi:MAG: FAD-binding oxidoreductase [Ruminococcaceae bacterium]|nr:FAD-binding oxidoreductase [Oscillospiraceae bacterium]